MEERRQKEGAEQEEEEEEDVHACVRVEERSQICRSRRARDCARLEEEINLMMVRQGICAFLSYLCSIKARISGMVQLDRITSHAVTLCIFDPDACPCQDQSTDNREHARLAGAEQICISCVILDVL